jgi:hypothetical protein
MGHLPHIRGTFHTFLQPKNLNSGVDTLDKKYGKRPIVAGDWSRYTVITISKKAVGPVSTALAAPKEACHAGDDGCDVRD